jgi:molybdate transport system ATP-binding protein
MSLEMEVGLERDGFHLEARLSVPAGRTVALLGPNGAGKSTLVGVLAGLVTPRTGVVALDGEILDDPATGSHVPAERRPVGIMFQDLLLFPHLSAVENVAFPLRARGAGRAESQRRAVEWLDRMGVASVAQARPSTLSGGEAQRVALARALVQEPRLLVLDEPLSALDVRARGVIRSLVRSTLEGFDGVRVVVTHDPVDAMTLTDRLVLMENGRITQEGTPEQIRTGPRTHYAAELVGVNLFAGRLVPLEEGAGRLETSEGDVVVAWPHGVDGPLEGVIGLVRPADVSLFRARPEGSARNVVRGVVASLVPDGERIRVRIEGFPALVAEVTRGSAARLGLSEGTAIWASFKAVEVQLVLP